VRYQVVLGLGSNLGDRLANLRRAVELVEKRGLLAVDGRSSVFESEPIGPPQPDYLNAAVSGHTELQPEALLTELLAVERALGRTRPDPVRWGPRTIDIDILWSSAGSYESATLTVPHPRLAERAFALQPLLELVPDARDAQDRHTYAELEAARTPLRRVGAL
jgi:2-amino-4-hydroxy-6-hydroxymethyldihydropteridine diphosphokinase